ncbi:MAG TPA: hypothetical protein VIJ34_12415 [Acidimicrobiales bacterium]
MEPLTHRLLRRSERGTPARSSLSSLVTSESGIDNEQFAGRWIAILDQRVIIDDESPAGLMRRLWESRFPVDDVQVQFVDDPSSGPAAKVS